MNSSVKEILKLINIDTENSIFVKFDGSKADENEEMVYENTVDTLDNHEFGKFSELISKVRSVTKIIRRFEPLENLLRSCCEVREIKFTKLELDVITR